MHTSEMAIVKVKIDRMDFSDIPPVNFFNQKSLCFTIHVKCKSNDHGHEAAFDV